MQRCFESLAFGREEWSTEMVLCFLSLLPRHNYSRGLSICNTSLQIRKLYGKRQSEAFVPCVPFCIRLYYCMISMEFCSLQVVTLAVYTFFFACLIGRQFLDTDQGYQGHDLDIYIPIFTLLQFFFYAGWLKVNQLSGRVVGEPSLGGWQRCQR